MGEWYAYHIESKNQYLAEKLRALGLLKHEEDATEQVILHHRDGICEIQTKKIAIDVPQDFLDSAFGDAEGEAKEDFKVLYFVATNLSEYRNPEEQQGDCLKYYTKWMYSDMPVYFLSKLLPDDVLKMSVDAPYYDEDCIMHFKDGNLCNKNGVLALGPSFNVRSSMVRDAGNNWSIGLPIGTGSEKWGRILVPKDNVERAGSDYTVVLTSEQIPVVFRFHTEVLTPKQIVEKKSQAKAEYRNAMQAPVVFQENEVSVQERERDGNRFYIMQIPCSTEVSESAFLSIVTNQYDHQGTEWHIGEFGKERNAMVERNGSFIKIPITNGEIRKSYEDRQQEIANLRPRYEMPEEQETPEQTENTSATDIEIS